MIFIFLIFSSRDRICGLFRPTKSEQDDSNRPHFPARCLSSVIEPTTGAIHRYTGSRKPVDWRTSQIWWPNVLTHKQKPDMLTIDDMQTYCKDVYLISLCNRWPMTFDDRSLQCHWNTGCCLSLIDYFWHCFINLIHWYVDKVSAAFSIDRVQSHIYLTAGF